MASLKTAQELLVGDPYLLDEVKEEGYDILQKEVETLVRTQPSRVVLRPSWYVGFADDKNPLKEETNLSTLDEKHSTMPQEVRRMTVVESHLGMSGVVGSTSLYRRSGLRSE
jgi:hypothetical protein